MLSQVGNKRILTTALHHTTKPCYTIPLWPHSSVNCHVQRSFNTVPSITSYNYKYQQQRRTGTTVIALSIASVIYVVLDNDNKVHAADTPYRNTNIQQPIDLFTHQLSHVIQPIVGTDITLAPRYKRVIAAIIDSIITSGISTLLGQLLSVGTATFVPAMIATITYDIVLNLYFNGQTLGKILLSMRTVRNDGRDIDLYTATLLYTGKLLGVVFGIDVIYSLFNNDKQCLHNKLTDTVVVNSVSPINTLFEANKLIRQSWT